jgi:hypothetical protein
MFWTGLGFVRTFPVGIKGFYFVEPVGNVLGGSRKYVIL